MKPVTIRDLAERLGLTHSTISRALSPGGGRSRVSPGTRDRILQLAREMGYRPNALARQLVSRRTHSVGIIVRHLNDPFASNLIQEIHVNLTRRGYLGMFFSARTPEEFDHALDSSVSRRVDGLISVMLRPEEKAKVERVSVPIVYYADPDPGVSSVGPLPFEGITRAMDHLVGLGHRKIGYIGRTDARNPRFRGFRRFLRLHALPAKAAWVRGVDGERLNLSVDGAFDEGCRLMRTLMDLPDRPTATVCHNDVMAVGALRALHAGGWKVPREMALVGFDNLREGEYAAVPLTTVDPHIDRIARQLTDMLVARIEAPSAPPVVLRLSPTLVIRESTAGREG